MVFPITRGDWSSYSPHHRRKRSVSPLIGRRSPEWGLPVPWQEVGNALGGMAGGAGQHVAQPSFGIDVVELGGLDQGIDGGGALAPAIGSSKQPVLATDRDAAQGPVRRHCYRPCCSPPPYLCHFPVVDHGGPTSGTWLGGG